MKPFRFRLEKLLNVRQQQSKMAQNALALARVRTRQATAFLESARAERIASEERLLKRRTTRMTALEFRLAAQLHDAIIEREKQARQSLETALAEEARRREELMEAERREKTLDRLKERQAAAHRIEMEAWEQAQLDEMAQNIFREGGGRR
ncbi:MAG: flagellar export protein FliJ [Bacillota bacterium]